MLPAEARRRPIRQRIVVVLPTPLRPITATISRSLTARSMPRRIGVAPYRADRPETSSIMRAPEVDLLDTAIGDDVLDRATSEHLAEMQHGHIGGDLAHERHIVLHDQHRRAIGIKALDQFASTERLIGR